MKKVLITALVASSVLGATAYATSTISNVKTRAVDVSFKFDACGAEWQVRHNVLDEVVSLDKKNEQGVYVWTVNRAYDSIVKNIETPEQFMDNFLTIANNKLTTYCGDNGGQVPAKWDEWISYIIQNETNYNASNNTLTRD